MEPPNSFEFPYQPYKIQEDFMTQLYSVLESKKCGIFESPTGTGKSLSIVCSALKWLKDRNNFEMQCLEKQIKKLEAEKQLEESKGDSDWLSVQAKTIEITRELNDLHVEYNKIKKYYENIDEIKSNAKKVKNQSQRFKKTQSSSKNTEDENELNRDSLDDDDEDNLLISDTKDLETNPLEEETEEQTKFKPIQIFICSRTHSQLSQLVCEIRKSPFCNNVRVVSLASRQNYCINPSVKNLRNASLINERCLDLQKTGAESKTTKKDEDGKVLKKNKSGSCKCPFFRREAIDELKDAVVTHLQDVEDLVTTGKEFQACPYYASRRAVEFSEVILVPYNTILHKATREANGIELKGNVLIIDEAHNLLEALTQMYGSSVSYEQLKLACQQLKAYKNRYSTKFSAQNLLCINQLIFIVAALMKQLENKNVTNSTDVFSVNNFVVNADIDNYNMFKLVDFVKNSRLSQKLHGFSIKYPNPIEKQKEKNAGLKSFLTSMQKVPKQEVIEPMKDDRPKISNPLLSVVSFLEALTNSVSEGRILVHRAEKTLQYLLLNPSAHFQDIVKIARSIIVAGGTMKPISEFKDRLFIKSGVEPERILQFSCDHIVPPENILPIVVAEDSILFNYENRLKMGCKVKQVLLDVCKVVPGGVIAFFPSFKYESFIWDLIKSVDFKRPIFREPQQGCSVESVLDNYNKAIFKSSLKKALLLSVVGGKLSEGLNFNDDLGRCVIVFGLPYANIQSPELKEKMLFLDNNEGIGAGKRFYENLCMKAVNQCIGRAVRHENDYACVLLVDGRYNRPSTKKALPDWIQRSLKCCSYKNAFENITTFFKDKK